MKLRGRGWLLALALYGCAHPLGYMSEPVPLEAAPGSQSRVPRALAASDGELTRYAASSRMHAIEVLRRLIEALVDSAAGAAAPEIYRRMALVLASPTPQVDAPEPSTFFRGVLNCGLPRQAETAECRYRRTYDQTRHGIAPRDLWTIPSPLMRTLAGRRLCHQMFRDGDGTIQRDKRALYEAFAGPQLGRDYPGEDAQNAGVLRLLTYLEQLGTVDEVDYQFAVAFAADTPEGVALVDRFAARVPRVRVDEELKHARMTPRERERFSGRRVGWLGLLFKGEANGLRVLRVVAGSPAAEAGVAVGDQVISVNQVPLNDPKRAIQLVQSTAIGRPIELRLLASGSERHVSVVIKARPDPFAWMFRGRTLFETAIVFQRWRLVETMLARGQARPESLAALTLLPDVRTRTRLLELLTRYGASARATCLAPALVTMYEPLIRAGADPNQACAGVSPLASAIRSRAAATVELLLTRGARPTADAIRSAFLLAGNPDASSYALRMLELLKRHEADLTVSCIPPRAFRVLEQLLQLGASPNTACDDGKTPLALAITGGDLPSVELLLARGAAVDVEAVRRLLAIQVLQSAPPATHAGLIGGGGLVSLVTPASRGLPRAAVEALLDRLLRGDVPGIDAMRFDTPSRDGPLHLAARAGLTSAVAALVRGGARINQANEYLEQPLDVAASPAMVEALRALGARPGDAVAIASLRQRREEAERRRQEAIRLQEEQARQEAAELAAEEARAREERLAREEERLARERQDEEQQRLADEDARAEEADRAERQQASQLPWVGSSASPSRSGGPPARGGGADVRLQLQGRDADAARRQAQDARERAAQAALERQRAVAERERAAQQEAARRQEQEERRRAAQAERSRREAEYAQCMAGQSEAREARRQCGKACYDAKVAAQKRCYAERVSDKSCWRATVDDERACVAGCPKPANCINTEVSPH